MYEGLGLADNQKHKALYDLDVGGIDCWTPLMLMVLFEL